MSLKLTQSMGQKGCSGEGEEMGHDIEHRGEGILMYFEDLKKAPTAQSSSKVGKGVAAILLRFLWSHPWHSPPLFFKLGHYGQRNARFIGSKQGQGRRNMMQ